MRPVQAVEARRGRQEDRPRPPARRPCRATTPRGQVLTGSLPVAMSLFPLWLPLARGIAPRLACLQPGTKLLTPRALVKSHPRAKRLSQSRLSAANPGASPGRIPAAPFPASPRADGEFVHPVERKWTRRDKVSDPQERAGTCWFHRLKRATFAVAVGERAITPRAAAARGACRTR